MVAIQVILWKAMRREREKLCKDMLSNSYPKLECSLGLLNSQSRFKIK